MTATRTLPFMPKLIGISIAVYHFMITWFAWQFILEHAGDAKRYWFLTSSSEKFLQQTPLPFREDFLYYINYFFAVQLNLPFWFGFLLYSSIGLLSIFYLYKIMLTLIQKTPHQNKWLSWLLLAVLFLPSLHFWTGMLGKEPLCFLGITLVCYSLVKEKGFSIAFLTGIVLLLIVRPHIALLLGLSVFMGILFKKKIFKLAHVLLLMAFATLSLIILVKTSWLPNISFQSLNRLMEVHHEVLSRTSTYVPLEDYNIFYKFFTFYYRPFPFELNSLLGFMMGTENIFSLILSVAGVGALLLLLFKHRYQLSQWEYTFIFFFILLAMVLSLAYSNFGLISRMKNQSLPFFLVLCSYWTGIYLNTLLHEKTETR